MRLELLADNARLETAGRATYGMSNLRRDSTGLPFIVFISQKDVARRAARVKWSPQPKVQRDLMGAYAISPSEHKAGQRLDSEDENSLRRWVDLNRDVLQQYRDGDIDYTQDAVDRLRRV